MKEMIQKRLLIISDLKGELNSLKESYDEIMEEDSLYQEAQEKEMEVREEKKASKTRLMSNPIHSSMAEDIKEKRREIKENNEALSVELVELYRNEGTTEITDTEGNIKRLKFSVRLVS